jgi:hypothetical protein
MPKGGRIPANFAKIKESGMNGASFTAEPR